MSYDNLPQIKRGEVQGDGGGCPQIIYFFLMYDKESYNESCQKKQVFHKYCEERSKEKMRNFKNEEEFFSTVKEQTLFMWYLSWSGNSCLRTSERAKICRTKRLTSTSWRRLPSPSEGWSLPLSTFLKSCRNVLSIMDELSHRRVFSLDLSQQHNCREVYRICK